MFGSIGKKAPLKRMSARQLRASFIGGTIIGSIILCALFFKPADPAWFNWIGRVSVIICLAIWWKTYLGELMRRKRN
jgi:hypothetical protein